MIDQSEWPPELEALRNIERLLELAVKIALEDRHERWADRDLVVVEIAAEDWHETAAGIMPPEGAMTVRFHPQSFGRAKVRVVWGRAVVANILAGNMLQPPGDVNVQAGVLLLVTVKRPEQFLPPPPPPPAPEPKP
jgi:hypothetical protein